MILVAALALLLLLALVKVLALVLSDDGTDEDLQP